ncbi:DoxX family protein, partial [Acinetobacter baumannii]
MNVALWIAAGLLMAGFLAAGLLKIVGKREQMLERMAWVEDFPQNQVKGIGVVEVLGAIGVVVPGITKIAPTLV